jgi:hypothetical protein
MAYQIPVGKSEEKKPLQKCRFRCGGVSRIDKPARLKEMAYQVVA